MTPETNLNNLQAAIYGSLSANFDKASRSPLMLLRIDDDEKTIEVIFGISSGYRYRVVMGQSWSYQYMEGGSSIPVLVSGSNEKIHILVMLTSLVLMAVSAENNMVRLANADGGVWCPDIDHLKIAIFNIIIDGNNLYEHFFETLPSSTHAFHKDCHQLLSSSWAIEESVISIAERLGMTVREYIEANEITNLDELSLFLATGSLTKPAEEDGRPG